jgi:hypothetical protein
VTVESDTCPVCRHRSYLIVVRGSAWIPPAEQSLREREARVADLFHIGLTVSDLD